MKKYTLFTEKQLENLFEKSSISNYLKSNGFSIYDENLLLDLIAQYFLFVKGEQSHTKEEAIYNSLATLALISNITPLAEINVNVVDKESGTMHTPLSVSLLGNLNTVTHLLLERSDLIINQDFYILEKGNIIKKNIFKNIIIPRLNKTTKEDSADFLELIAKIYNHKGYNEAEESKSLLKSLNEKLGFDPVNYIDKAFTLKQNNNHS